MTTFLGTPYIDLRVDFNSFLPEKLDKSIKEKSINYYLNKINRNKELHDKVEFEIVWSCFTFDLPEKLNSLPKEKFSWSDKQELLECLRNVTNSVLHPVNGLWLTDAEKIKTLAQRRKKINESELSLTDRVYWLIEDVKRYGTLPFAGLARACFMAVQILRSLQAKHIFTKNDYEKFLKSTSTISKDMYFDRQNLSKRGFLKKYGHLRPGTYDILSSRYDETPDLYFNWDEKFELPNAQETFSLTEKQANQVDLLLRKYKLETDSHALFNFIRRTIELRELSKFEFSHNLSDALQIIGKVGETENIELIDMAFCDIKAIQDIHVSACDTGEALRESINAGKKSFQETCKICLPPVIASPDDVYRFELPESSPSFITHKQVEAPVAGIDEVENLENAIVCIHSADPGFDWLFSYPIAGLITAWGGANSHMAIRAKEFNLPAVIGIGEALYQSLKSASVIELDATNRKIEIVG